jgi:hypothetical protein
MRHCTRCLSLCSTLVLFVLGPAVSLADDSSNPYDPPSAEEGQKPPARVANDDARRRSDAKNPSEPSGSSDRKPRDPKSAAAAVPARVNEAFTFPLSGGCNYGSTVRGTVRTVKTGAGEEPRYVPTLVLNAWVSCQNNTELRVTDNTLRDVAMTRPELEQAIELHASLLAESASARCAFVPDFLLADNKLSGLGVSYLCPSASASQIGGGPLEEPPDDSLQPSAPGEARPPAGGETRPSSVRQVPERAPDARTPPDRRAPRARGAPDDHQ